MNNSRIIYAADDGAVAVIVPAPEWLAQEGNTLEALAQKDVPPGKTWEIVDAANVPQPSPPAPPAPTKAELMAQLHAIAAQIAALPE